MSPNDFYQEGYRTDAKTMRDRRDEFKTICLLNAIRPKTPVGLRCYREYLRGWAAAEKERINAKADSKV